MVRGLMCLYLAVAKRQDRYKNMEEQMKLKVKWIKVKHLKS